MDWTPPANSITSEMNWCLSRVQHAFSTELGVVVSNEQRWHLKTQNKKLKNLSQISRKAPRLVLTLAWAASHRFMDISGSSAWYLGNNESLPFGEDLWREEGKWKQIQEIKKNHQAFKILFPLYAFNHSRSSRVYNGCGIFLLSTLKYDDLYKFSPSPSPCGRVNVAVGKTPWLTVEQLRSWIFYSPFWEGWLTPRAVCPLFEYSWALLEACVWKYSNLPGAHVSPYPVKDGLRLLWVFKNSILMTTHPKPSCVFLTVIRSYIKSRRAAITDPEQPSVGAGLQLRWSPAMRRGSWI